MQPNQFWQEQVVDQFLHASRLHLGLAQAPVASRPPLKLARICRRTVRSLLVVGTLGGLLNYPAFATEASRLPDDFEMTTTRHGFSGLNTHFQHQLESLSLIRGKD